jgi:hypothetical protein
MTHRMPYDWPKLPRQISWRRGCIHDTRLSQTPTARPSAPSKARPLRVPGSSRPTQPTAPFPHLCDRCGLDSRLWLSFSCSRRLPPGEALILCSTLDLGTASGLLLRPGADPCQPRLGCSRSLAGRLCPVVGCGSVANSSNDFHGQRDAVMAGMVDTLHPDLAVISTCCPLQRCLWGGQTLHNSPLPADPVYFVDYGGCRYRSPL